MSRASATAWIPFREPRQLHAFSLKSKLYREAALTQTRCHIPSLLAEVSIYRGVRPQLHLVVLQALRSVHSYCFAVWKTSSAPAENLQPLQGHPLTVEWYENA